jgi:replicative DNA helicase
MTSAYQVIERTEKGEQGILSGFRTLDQYTGGFYPKELTVIAGRPGIGKSTCLLQLALNMAMANKKVLLISYEVTQSEIGINILSNLLKINSMVFKTKKLNIADKDKVNKLVKQIDKIPLYVIDENSVDLEKLNNIVEKLKPDIVFVDYLNIMPDMGNNENTNSAISEIMRKLLAISGQHNIPVILVAAMNREAEKRTIVNFKLSDLRDSSSIEYNAHKVFFVWKNEDKLIIDIKKNRNGPDGISVNLKYYKQYHLIVDEGGN